MIACKVLPWGGTFEADVVFGVSSSVENLVYDIGGAEARRFLRSERGFAANETEGYGSDTMIALGKPLGRKEASAGA